MEETNKKESIFKKPWMQSLVVIAIVFGLLAAFLVWQTKSTTVFIENSTLVAPVVELSPVVPGVLNALYVKEGDVIAPNTQVALVGSQIVSSVQGGLVSSAPNLVGQYFNPGESVVSVVDTADMEVVGSLEENKGLSKIAVGDHATFTVDAFGGKVYQGIVDEVAPSAEDTGVAFSISDTRPVQKFDVKVRFDVSAYPELRNGMSAKITVSTK